MAEIGVGGDQKDVPTSVWSDVGVHEGQLTAYSWRLLSAYYSIAAPYSVQLIYSITPLQSYSVTVVQCSFL